MFVPPTVHVDGEGMVREMGRPLKFAAVGRPVRTICWPTTAVGLGRLALGPLMMGAVVALGLFVHSMAVVPTTSTGAVAPAGPEVLRAWVGGGGTLMTLTNAPIAL
jgi:hypothetical protein